MNDNNKQGWSLEIAEIPEPCTVPWNSMKGDDRIRFCGQCTKNVYNISNMTRAEAQALLIDSEGRVCITMLKRADGTIVSDKCPPILKPIRYCWRRVSAAVIAAFALVATISRANADDDCKKNAQPSSNPLPVRTAGKPMMNPDFGKYRTDTMQTINKVVQESKISVQPGVTAQLSIKADGTISTCKISDAKMQCVNNTKLESLILKTKLAPLPKSLAAPFTAYIPLSPQEAPNQSN